MERHPRDRQPASPVCAAEDEDAGNDREQSHEQNQERVRLKRTGEVELGRVICKSDDPDCNEQSTNGGNRSRAWPGHWALLVGSWYKPITFPAGSLNLAVISGASPPIGCTMTPPLATTASMVVATLSTMM